MKLTWVVVAAVALAWGGCGVDGRSMSYEVSALGATQSGTGGAMAVSAGGSASVSDAGESGLGGGGAGGEGGAAGGESSTFGGSSAPGQAGSTSGGIAGQVGIGGAPGMAGSAAAMSGSPAVAGAGSGGTSSAGAGSGGAGSAGVGGIDPNLPCGDLNLNHVDDCTETLVKNAGFDQNGAGWESEGSLKQSWQGEDARGAATSGSLVLTNTNVLAAGTGMTGLAAHQCVVAWTGDELSVSARVRIVAGQGAGKAGVNLTFFGGDDCGGSLVNGDDTALASASGNWLQVSGRLVAPPGARSARVRLIVEKPFADAAFEARFDDIVVLKR